MSRPVAAPRITDRLTTATLPQDDLVDDALLRALLLHRLDLCERSARLVDIEACRFERVSLHGCRIEKLTLSDCVLEDCDLANVRLVDSSWHRTIVRRTRLTGWDATNGTLRHVRLEDCTAAMASLRFAVLDRVQLVSCNLSQADFTEADLRGARFEGCDLSGAQLHGARMRGAHVVDCRLEGVQGVASLAGATIAAQDVLSLTYALAGALDITIADDDTDES
ncbi:MAG TPA: pentapeptide repeat-containing protein [Nocardioidaceae bacterium]|nr:pentapeptide repeat-containing protein [Nocardioidaceae bacterium]